MNGVIEINGLKKTLGNFQLSIDHLSIPKGFITGFIGENGAGKTTTIKLVMNMLFPDQGSVTVLGMDSRLQSDLIKQQLGYVGDCPGYLQQAKLRDIEKMISPFYTNWDKKVFTDFIDQFQLDLSKRYADLSKGMQKQFSLAIALSHHPQLIVMDEPTANLDPLVRNDFLDILSQQMAKEDVSVFFSTHITSDLEKTADYISFLHRGNLLLFEDKDTLCQEHLLVKGSLSLLTPDTRPLFIKVTENSFGFTGLCHKNKKVQDYLGGEAVYEKPTLEDIFIYYTKEGAR